MQLINDRKPQVLLLKSQVICMYQNSWLEANINNAQIRKDALLMII